MGQMGAVDTTGAVLGAGFVWLMFDKVSPQYRMGFLCAAGLACLAGVIYTSMHIPQLHKPRARMVFRKKYKLYYALELVFGARKQIFITFGPWVLIKVYGQPATSIAGLLMIAAVIGIVFKPVAGMIVDRFGERAVMIGDGLVLSVVCIGYGYALRLTGNPEYARSLACVCFIADNLLFALGSARIVYVSRQTDSPEELTSTLAMGVSINHVVSMTIPAVAGAVWSGFGYERVFLGAAILAISNAALSTFVPSKRARLLLGRR
jgi:predicted MFS family arabinose efflux permease